MTRLQPPMSPTRSQTPWPILAFNVMSKPGGPACNLSCEYCYYRHHQDGKAAKPEPEGKNNPAISEELLEQFIAQYIHSQDNPTVFFTWQGGEPTLVGLDFYRKVVALQQKHARPGITLANAFQTNGVLLDDTWCAFLAEHKFMVGLSIDGPEDIHDTFRRMRGGAPTYAKVRSAAACLHKHGVSFNTLSTITPVSVSQGREVYDFLTRELHATVLQFQPCVERKDFQNVAPGYWPADTIVPFNSPRLQPGHPDSLLTDWSITAQQWGQFLCELFDHWWSRDVGRVRINWFDSWASQFVGGPALMCISSPVCGRALSIEKDGGLYSCDHFVYPEYCIGKAGEGKTISDLVRSQRQKEFGEAKNKKLPGFCRRCPFLFACFGECPKRRFLKTPEGEAGLNVLCSGYRTFFNNAGKRLAEYGRTHFR